MPSLLRVDAPHLTGESRWAAGMQVASHGAHLAAGLVGAAGHGTRAKLSVAAARTAEIPRDTATLLNRILDDPSCPAALVAELGSDLADLGAALVGELLTQAGLPFARLLAVGVHDPGFWATGDGEPAGYLGLVDAARLAEHTGLNVIDAFPARDLAQGGLGGPVTALAEWLLLRHPRRDRLLLDLGRTIRMTFLPAEAADHAATRIVAFDVGPGTALLDLLAGRLSGGRQAFDPGGHLAAQGRRLAPLLEHWLTDPYFSRPLPRWHPRGVAAEPFLASALHMAVEHGWSVRDLLCTATHFLAEMISVALRTRLPENASLDEIVIVGGGRQNGMLLREIARRIEVPLVQCADVGMAETSLEPASIAVLALLHVDQVPANATAITGAEVPRLLGRITPGSPQSWQRLLQAQGESAPQIRPLRAAV